MAVQIRDTPFGHLTRLITKNAIFQYPEEVASNTLVTNKKQEKDDLADPRRYQPSPGDVESAAATEAFEDKADKAEATKDKYLVDWYGPKDPEVSRTRSNLKIYTDI